MDPTFTAPAQTGSWIDSLAHAYQVGGFMMHFILLAGIVAIAVSVHKWFQLRRLSINGPAFMNEISKLVHARDLDGALRHCDAARSAALPHVCKAGLMRVNRIDKQTLENQTVVQNSISGAVLEVVPKVEGNIPVLSLIANVSTLLGLLGTIIGMIHAFAALESASGAERAGKLAAAIAEAMNCTGFGLAVAILAMILHTLFTLKADHMIGQLNEYAVKLMNLLSYKTLEHSGSKVD